jgi:hypothetical protein
MTKLPRQEKKQNFEELNKCFMRVSLNGRFNSASLQIGRSTLLFLVLFTLLWLNSPKVDQKRAGRKVT